MQSKSLLSEESKYYTAEIDRGFLSLKKNQLLLFIGFFLLFFTLGAGFKGLDIYIYIVMHALMKKNCLGLHM